MAVELYEDGTASSLASGAACAGGQGNWYQCAWAASAAQIASGEFGGKSDRASFLDLTTPFEVGRIEFENRGYSDGCAWLNYADGASQDGLCLTSAGQVFDVASGTFNLLGSFSTSPATGDILALEVLSTGNCYGQLDQGSGFSDEFGSTGSPVSCNTRTGDMAVGGRGGGGNKLIDNLYGPAAAVGGGFFARAYYDRLLAGGAR